MRWLVGPPAGTVPAMAAHPFQELRPEYERLLATMQITRAEAVDRAARAVLANADRSYLPVQRKTGVPAALIGTLNLRESDQDFRTGLGQGDRWDRVSVHVPAGKGPFASWEDAAIYYIHHDHLDDNSAPWSMSYVCWKGEIWNGFGPRNHGIHTGYLWAGTSHYTRGKYVADGVWNAGHVDTQLGIIPVIMRMIELRPALAIGAPVPPSNAPAPQLPLPAPTGLRGAFWIQDGLNWVMHLDPPLDVDGSYGRRTREAVRTFQQLWGLTPDGLAGRETCATLDRALAGEKPPVSKPAPRPSPMPAPTPQQPDTRNWLQVLLDAIASILKR